MNSLIFSLLFLLIRFFSVSPQQNKCVILHIIFEENNLNELIIHSGNIDTIRVNDLSGYFKGEDIQCDYESYKIFVQDKFMVDFNTGRYIDVFIHSFEIKDDIIDFSISYAQRTINCQSDYLVMGNILLEIKEGKYSYKSSKFVHYN